MRIYVGNLSYSTTEETLRETFEQFGQVNEVSIITDRDTGRPRGFAFVEMADDDEAAKAIGALAATWAKAKGIQAVVFDRGGFKFHGRIKAIAEAVREGGVKC